MFDLAVRKLVGISDDEFIRRWEDGEYWENADKPDQQHIGDQIAVIPLARQDA